MRRAPAALNYVYIDVKAFACRFVFMPVIGPFIQKGFELPARLLIPYV